MIGSTWIFFSYDRNDWGSKFESWVRKTGNNTEFYNGRTWRCSWSLKIDCTLRCIYLTASMPNVALFFFFYYATVHSISQKQWNSIWRGFLFLITQEGLFCVSASSWLKSAMITESLWKVSHWRLSKICYCNISKLSFEIAIPCKTVFLKCSWQD